MTLVILNQIIAMMVIMIIGIIAAKTKIITEKGNKELSNLLLMVVNPLVIFMAFQKDFSGELLRNLLVTFCLAMLTYAVLIPISHLLLKGSSQKSVVERFATVYSNCGFFGIPMVKAALGDEGVFYLTAVLAAFNIMVWTHGVLLMQQGKGLSGKELLKNLTNGNIIGIILGLFCFFLRIHLGGNIRNGLQFVADMNTPLAMLIAGISLTQVRLGEVLKEKRVYLVSTLKLVIYPLLMIFLFRFIPAAEMVKQTVLIAVACPVGATVTLFAIRFDKDAPYASALYALNTIMAMLTMPLVLALI